jgi:hypothetical protein
MNILANFHLSLSPDDVLRGQGLNPELIHAHKPFLLAVAEQACSQGLSLLHPIALTRKVAVYAIRHNRILLKGGLSFTSPVMIRHFEGANQVVVAICTIGRELEESVTDLLEADPQLALALDGLGNAAVEMLTQQVCAHIAENVQAKGWTASTPISPGISGWPVEVGQPQIYSLLDPSEIGISLTSGGMMLPKKSASFIVSIGSEMSKINMCEVCNLKETCRYLHA